VIEALLLAAAMASHAHTDLVAAAAASGRPPECTPVARNVHRMSNVWAQARVPELRKYCFALSRAHARLHTDPAGALTAAKAAEAVLGGRAAPQVVMARAALREGRVNDALAAFDEALKRDPRSIEQPAAMHDLARARLESGQLRAALEAYRVLVPRASLLSSRTLRARVLLEAAHASMAQGATTGGDRKRGLDEALAYLREASRDGHHALRQDVALSLTLTLERAGRSAQADAILNEQRGTSHWARRHQAPYLANPDDLHWLRALAQQADNPGAAAEHYQAYLDSPSGSGAYAAIAQARLRTLRRRR